MAARPQFCQTSHVKGKEGLGLPLTSPRLLGEALSGSAEHNILSRLTVIKVHAAQECSGWVAVKSLQHGRTGQQGLGPQQAVGQGVPAAPPGASLHSLGRGAAVGLALCSWPPPAQQPAAGDRAGPASDDRRCCGASRPDIRVAGPGRRAPARVPWHWNAGVSAAQHWGLAARAGARVPRHVHRQRLVCCEVGAVSVALRRVMAGAPLCMLYSACARPLASRHKLCCLAWQKITSV